MVQSEEFEADDLIATYTKQALDRGHKVTSLSIHPYILQGHHSLWRQGNRTVIESKCNYV